jgi:hypothetical protein
MIKTALDTEVEELDLKNESRRGLDAEDSSS